MLRAHLPYAPDATCQTAFVAKDFLSALLLFLVYILCFCLGLNFVNGDYPGGRILAGLLLVLGAVALAGFVYLQLHTSSKPVVDIRLLIHLKRRALFLATFFGEAATMGVCTAQTYL